MENNCIEKIFDLHPAKGKFIGIISIPHSGEKIPSEFIPYLESDFKKVSRDVDTAVHKLIDIKHLNEAGISVIKAHIHRAAIDLNRKESESMLNWQKNSHGERIVVKNPNENIRRDLQKKYHAPYYEMLKSLIHKLQDVQGKEQISFVDLHSMPSTATEYHLNINPHQDIKRPDFCLSDIKGLSCTEDFMQTFYKNFKKNYTETSINKPYVGGNITRKIHELYPNINNIQIEINRELYLDEGERVLIKDKAHDLKEKLTDILIQSFQSSSN